MKTVRIGIMPEAELRKYMLDIAAGRIKPKRDAPKIWFHSMKSLSEVLSDSNRNLLKIIADKQPENIKELAKISGRQPSNLSRTLKTFEQYGFVTMEKTARSKRPVSKPVKFDIQITA